MNVKCARDIDRLCGIPLCFLFSFFARMGRLFNKPKEKKIHRIVFLGLTEIGAGILAYPAIRKVRSAWPGADIYFWTFKDHADFFTATRWFPEDHVIAVRSDTFFNLAVDTIRNLWRLNRAGIDTIIDLEVSTRFSSLLCFLSGAVTRVGFHSQAPRSFYRGHLYTHQVVYDYSRHISRNYQSLVTTLLELTPLSDSGSRTSPDGGRSLPKIETSDEENKKLTRKLCESGGLSVSSGRIVLIHLGVNDRIPIRRWPLEYYQELIGRLLKDPRIFVVLVGTGPERSFSRDNAEGRIINLIGKTDARELFALLNTSNILVSHDSGIVHIAALTGIPVVALFGPETPDVFGPLNNGQGIILYKKFPCSPCLLPGNYKQSPCRDNRCMKAIAVDEVCAEVMKVLS